MADAGVNKLTERELKTAVTVFQCFKNNEEVDYDKLGKIMEWKNAATARAAWIPLRKKLTTMVDGDEENDNAAEAPSASTTPAKNPRKRKPKTSDAVGDDKEKNESVKTPRNKKARKTSKEEPTEDDALKSPVKKDEDEEETKLVAPKVESTDNEDATA